MQRNLMCRPASAVLPPRVLRCATPHPPPQVRPPRLLRQPFRPRQRHLEPLKNHLLPRSVYRQRQCRSSNLPRNQPRNRLGNHLRNQRQNRNLLRRKSLLQSRRKKRIQHRNLLRNQHRLPHLHKDRRLSVPQRAPLARLRCSAGPGRRSSRTLNRTAGSCGRSCSKTSRSPATTERRSHSGSATPGR